jgi:hypothetical protein
VFGLAVGSLACRKVPYRTPVQISAGHPGGRVANPKFLFRIRPAVSFRFGSGLKSGFDFTIRIRIKIKPKTFKNIMSNFINCITFMIKRIFISSNSMVVSRGTGEWGVGVNFINKVAKI